MQKSYQANALTTNTRQTKQRLKEGQPMLLKQVEVILNLIIFQFGGKAAIMKRHLADMVAALIQQSLKRLLQPQY